jgi:hypothetical protein
VAIVLLFVLATGGNRTLAEQTIDVLLLRGHAEMDFGRQPPLDEKYQRMLAEQGLRVTQIHEWNPLMLEYLRQFHEVIYLNPAPYMGGGYFDIAMWRSGEHLLTVRRNVEILKQYVAAATYRDGGQVDDGLFAYHWHSSNGSLPIPIAVHEIDHPEQLQRAAETGLQCFVNSNHPGRAAFYFRQGHGTAGGNPMRYYVSLGPRLDEYWIHDWQSPHSRKRGQVQFAGTARRVLRTNWTCPRFQSRVLLW